MLGIYNRLNKCKTYLNKKISKKLFIESETFFYL